MIEKYMKNLRELILKKMEEGNYTISRFADECGVSEREISSIKNGEAYNIRFDTLVKICENSGISYLDVLELKDETYSIFFNREMEKSFLIHNGEKYRIILEKENL